MIDPGSPRLHTGHRNDFDPAELLLAAPSACTMMGIERVTPILKFSTSP